MNLIPYQNTLKGCIRQKLSEYILVSTNGNLINSTTLFTLISISMLILLNRTKSCSPQSFMHTVETNLKHFQEVVLPYKIIPACNT
jgi:hypothetical protein